MVSAPKSHKASSKYSRLPTFLSNGNTTKFIPKDKLLTEISSHSNPWMLSETTGMDSRARSKLQLERDSDRLMSLSEKSFNFMPMSDHADQSKASTLLIKMLI
jgi:hypothetical protein